MRPGGDSRRAIHAPKGNQRKRRTPKARRCDVPEQQRRSSAHRCPPISTTAALLDLAGPEKHLPHYEQILQRLAEVHVVRQLVRCGWPWQATFEDEPTVAGSDKNPEILVRGQGMEIGVEVKAPAILEHQRKRSTRPLQAGGRVFPLEQLEEIAGGVEKLTLPRDNPG